MNPIKINNKRSKQYHSDQEKQQHSEQDDRDQNKQQHAKQKRLKSAR